MAKNQIFSLGFNAGNPSSQSEYRIHFILPARGASHIIKELIPRSHVVNECSPGHERLMTVTFSKLFVQALNQTLAQVNQVNRKLSIKQKCIRKKANILTTTCGPPAHIKHHPYGKRQRA